MAYLKPAFFPKRVFNPIAMRFGLSGSCTGKKLPDPEDHPVFRLEFG